NTARSGQSARSARPRPAPAMHTPSPAGRGCRRRSSGAAAVPAPSTPPDLNGCRSRSRDERPERRVRVRTAHPKRAVHSTPMDEDRPAPGAPVLHRQPRPTPALPPSLRELPARSVPELRPTPLQDHYINLSFIALIAGAIAISALELGVGFGSPIVKLCVVIAGPIL